MHLTGLAGPEQAFRLSCQFAVLGHDPGDEERDRYQEPDRDENPVGDVDAGGRGSKSRAVAKREEVGTLLVCLVDAVRAGDVVLDASRLRVPAELHAFLPTSPPPA